MSVLTLLGAGTKKCDVKVLFLQYGFKEYGNIAARMACASGGVGIFRHGYFRLLCRP